MTYLTFGVPYRVKNALILSTWLYGKPIKKARDKRIVQAKDKKWAPEGAHRESGLSGGGRYDTRTGHTAQPFFKAAWLLAPFVAPNSRFRKYYTRKNCLGKHFLQIDYTDYNRLSWYYGTYRNHIALVMKAPPRQMSPLYKTSDWPGVMARSGFTKSK